MVVKYDGFVTFFSRRLFSFFFRFLGWPAHRTQFWSEMHAYWLKSRIPIDTLAF